MADDRGRLSTASVLSSVLSNVPMALMVAYLLVYLGLAFHFVFVLFAPAVEQSKYVAGQVELVENAAEQVVAVDEVADLLDGAQESLNVAVSGEDDEALLAIEQANQAVEKAEDLVATLPSGSDVDREEIDEAIDEAQAEITSARTGDQVDDGQVSAIVEDAEDAVDGAREVIEQAVVEGAESLLNERPPTNEIVVLGTYTWRPSSELVLLALSAAGAALGSATSSLVALSGKRSWWDIFIASISGVPIASIGYVAIRGGLMNLNGSAGSLNPYAILAISAIFGLNSKGVHDKLLAVVGRKSAA